MLRHFWNIFNGRRESQSQGEKPTDLFKIISCKANDPCEDRISYGAIQQINAHYLAVFDGHGGPKVSECLHSSIHNIIINVVKNRSKIVSDQDALIKVSLKQIF